MSFSNVMNSRFFEWLGEIRWWLREQWIPAVGFFAIIISVIFCYGFDVEPESRIYCGLILQIIGMLIALDVLEELRKRFKLGSIKEMIEEWFSRIPKWKKRSYSM